MAPAALATPPVTLDSVPAGNTNEARKDDCQSCFAFLEKCRLEDKKLCRFFAALDGLGQTTYLALLTAMQAAVPEGVSLGIGQIGPLFRQLDLKCGNMSGLGSIKGTMAGTVKELQGGAGTGGRGGRDGSDVITDSAARNDDASTASTAASSSTRDSGGGGGGGSDGTGGTWILRPACLPMQCCRATLILPDSVCARQ